METVAILENWLFLLCNNLIDSDNDNKIRGSGGGGLLNIFSVEKGISVLQQCSIRFRLQYSAFQCKHQIFFNILQY